MLTTLRIKNLALVADLTLELQPGYNVITGETGAGKSILIGALNLVLGERADRTLIRGGCESCSVEAVFNVTNLCAHKRGAPVSDPARRRNGLERAGSETGAPPLESFLEANGVEPCEENQLVLKRTFTSNGTNRQFVNGSPTTLGVLANIGEWLVDIHGPHDHQSLLHPAKQLAILDAFAGLEKEREAFGELVRRRDALEREKAALIVDEKTYVQQLELLRFQVKEIESARLQPGEDQEVEAQFSRASNAAKLLQLSQAALEELSEDENAPARLGETCRNCSAWMPARPAWWICTHKPSARSVSYRRRFHVTRRRWTLILPASRNSKTASTCSTHSGANTARR